MTRLGFKVLKEDPNSSARTTTFTTLHGEVHTPIFMPVGTQATVKGLTVETLKSLGSNVLLANTYHLMLRPGVEVFKKFGGIHKFMNWDGPVLTDSGGFQIFSLENERKITEEGAQFKSYVDGKTFLLSPEESIAVQNAIGSDIMMVLDQCVPSTSAFDVADAAMKLTNRWAARSLKARGDSPQALFGIVQGACYPDLRRQSAETICAMDFDGFAIGGLAVGETKAQREDFCELTAALLPKDRPRYLMGVGTPLDILEAVHRGVDMFDCIIPSSLAKRGTAFTSHGKIHIYRGAYKLAEGPIDPDCPCSTCTTYSRAYIHHLIKSDEYLGWKLMSKHNFFFYHRMMKEIRAAIEAGTFKDYYLRNREAWARGDDENPMRYPVRKKPPKVIRD
jgi:queuine tRNA-ribosyltransferase